MAIAAHVRRAFRFDREDSGPVVELVVERLDALFNPLDRAPWHRRDLASDLKAYFADCSAWLPVGVPLTVEIAVREQDPVAAHQAEVADGIRHYFAYLAEQSLADDAAARLRLRGFVAMSAACLWAAWALDRWLDVTSPPANLVHTGLLVGGWVFLWETVSVLFVRRLDVDERRSKLMRLATAEIRFV